MLTPQQRSPYIPYLADKFFFLCFSFIVFCLSLLFWPTLFCGYFCCSVSTVALSPDTDCLQHTTKPRQKCMYVCLFVYRLGIFNSYWPDCWQLMLLFTSTSYSLKDINRMSRIVVVVVVAGIAASECCSTSCN